MKKNDKNIVSSKYSFLAFVHINKTAGTTLKYILRNSFGLYHCDSIKTKTKIFTQKDLDFAAKIFPGIRCISGHNVVEPTNYFPDSAGYITILREPVMRTISHYQDDVVRGKQTNDLAGWLEQKEMHNLQVKMIAGEENLEKAKELLNEKYLFVGLTEDFEDSLRLLKILSPFYVKLGYFKTVYAKDNKVKNKLLNDPEAVSMLEKANDLDIELYKYAKEKVYGPIKERYREEINNIPLSKIYKTSMHFKYYCSICFNKYVYRQLIKINKKKES